MKKLLIAAAVLCIAVAACKKDDGGQTNTTGSRKDTLTTGKWHISSATGTTTFLGKDTTIDLFGQFDPCAKDDYYYFRTGGNVTNDQGSLKCDTTGPQQTDGGTWSLNAGMDTLRMYGGTLPGAFRILSFSNANMQLQADTNYSGFPFKVKATFQHDN